jgi:predicted negative regulator of RcsB-dependent stress response
MKSESYFHKALGQPGSKENDRGMIYAFLATIYLNRGQKKEAEKYLKKAKQTGASKAKNQMIEILEKKF